MATGSENVSSLLRADNFAAEIEARVAELEERPQLAFEKDFLRWMLSDGAGAAWLSPEPNPEGISLRLDWIRQFSYAGQMETCMYAGAEKLADGSLRGWRESSPRSWLEDSRFSIRQDVKLLNEHIVDYTVTRPLRALQAAGLVRAAAIDWFLPHYSSDFFREKVAAGLAEAGCPIAPERWFTNLATKGNTGSASIYIILEELFHSGRLSRGEKLLCFVPESGRFSHCLHAADGSLMEVEQVPQDEISTQARARKAIYATNSAGTYEIIASSGWTVEETATRQAVAECERLAAAARAEVEAGTMAPLFFHMHNRRVDFTILAQAAGLSRWRLRRHCRARVFAGLAPRIKARYAEALGLAAGELERLPEAGS